MPSPGSRRSNDHHDDISASRFAKVGRTLDVVAYERKKKQYRNKVDFTILDGSRHSSANSSITFEDEMLDQGDDGRTKTAGKQVATSVECSTNIDSFRDMNILLHKKGLIIRILTFSILIMIPFLVGNLISSMESERTFLIFETIFFLYDDQDRGFFGKMRPNRKDSKICIARVV
mmetsp:Transcript_12526/g.23507  ORF Transcript_12526/g.23507 Transcript_12526/m.23507 type:complete len:175 (+) Transcript_12526:174-698(+)